MTRRLRSRLNLTVLTAGVLSVVLGAVSGAAAAPFDGFVRGFFQGAGVMLIIAGVYAVSRVLFRTEDNGSVADGWLPSRDGER